MTLSHALSDAAIAGRTLAGRAPRPPALRQWLPRMRLTGARYDYRAEWLRFSRTVAPPAKATDARAPLEDRILHAIADIVGSPGGALWQRQPEDGVLAPGTVWNMTDAPLACIPETAPMLKALRPGRAIPVADLPSAPDWLGNHPRAWMLLPLPHRDGLQGLLVLAPRPTGAALSAEDGEMLELVAWQAASHLAEEQAQQALAEARRLDAFNRRFAFIIHDIKNVVGQMSLIVHNSESFGGDPDFHKDMVETVRLSVQRMQGLLIQIKADERGEIDGPPPSGTLGGLVDAVSLRWRGIDLAIRAETSLVVPDVHRLGRMLDHLIANATDAVGRDGRITLSAWPSNADGRRSLVLEVADDGPGMDAAFVRDHLFRPLDTVKTSGWGMGAWQCRDLAGSLGGRLEVDTAPGDGTRMRIVLPLADPSAASTRLGHPGEDQCGG